MTVGQLAGRAMTYARRGPSMFVIAHNLTNVVNYAFLLAMARALRPDEFGLFAALFGAIYLASALANSTQITMAALVAGADANQSAALAGAGVRRLLATFLPVAMVAAVCLRPAAAFLHTGDLTAVALTGAAACLLLLAAVGYGALQGSGRFAFLGFGLLVAAVGRLALSGLLVWLGLGVQGTILGVVAGLALSALLVLAPYMREIFRPASRSLPQFTNLLVASLASLAIAIPTSADVVLMRHYVPVQEAGAYAAVSVLGKVVIFAPIAVSLVFFPSFVRAGAARRTDSSLLRLNLLGTGAIALPLAVGVAWAGAALPQVFFRGYATSSPFLWSYVAAMLAFSFVVTLLYYAVAHRSTGIVVAVCAGLAAELATISVWHPSLTGVALVLLAGNTALVAAGLLGCGAHANLPQPRVRDLLMAAGTESQY